MSTARRRYSTAAAAALLFVAVVTTTVHAQLFPRPFELSGSIHVDEVDSATRAHLERVKAYLADGQWDEAVETLRQVMQNSGAKCIALDRRRYVNVTDYCQVQLSGLPSEALALYRERVDPQAQRLYEQGLARRDADQLEAVVDQFFCSTWGDDALLALGELALERGDYGGARAAWSKLIEQPPDRIVAADFARARGQQGLAEGDVARIDHWYVKDESTDPPVYRLRRETLSDADCAELVRFWKAQRVAPTRLSYPGTTFDLATIRARLALTSILEGSLDRAAAELKAFEQLHSHAEGHLAGRQVKYSAELRTLLDAAAGWAARSAESDWPTFAGSPRRTKVVARPLDLGRAAWAPISLSEPPSADVANSRTFNARRVAEDARAPLSYHPVVVGNLLLINDQTRIFAFDLRTGKPAWKSADASRAPGEIYRDGSPVLAVPGFQRGLGVPRFTMTAHAGKLYARMGSQVTSRPLESNETGSGNLVALDLNAEGRLCWKAELTGQDDDQWAFEGAPIVEGDSVYVAMRKNDVRPQCHVACLDAETGRRRWRSFVCSAETPAAGQVEETTHNLLTLEQGVLYCNTNLGSIAAISARDGRVRWISLYPRAARASANWQDKRPAHFYRDLNPCIYDRGLVISAPSDCEHIFALDAGTGELAWDTTVADDAIHLLGVGSGSLIATGDRVWWIDAATGKVLERWPDTTPLGYGRGTLAGDQILWSTRDRLFVLKQQPRAAHDVLAQPPISLGEGRGASGGNLLLTDDILIVATPDKLFAFRQRASSEAKAAVSPRRSRPSKLAERDSSQPKKNR